jgi:hypothetical protein
MPRTVPVSLLAGSLLLASLVSGAAVESRDSAGRKTMRKEALAARSAPVAGHALTAADMADKAAALDAQRYQDLTRLLQQGGSLDPLDRQFYTRHSATLVSKGGGAGVDEGGPDAFGNTWIMTGDEGGPAYFWVDLPEEDRTYVTFPGGADSFDGPFTMPTAISFYGESYTQFYVSAKCYMGFISDQMFQWNNTTLPNALAPNAQIYVFWDDMNPVAPSGGSVYYGTDEAGRLVVTWDNVYQYSDGPGFVTVQAVLDFDEDRVYLNHADFNESMPLNSCTVGIENHLGTDALQVLANGDPFVPSVQTTIQVDLAPPPDYAAVFDPRTLDLVVGTPGENDAVISISNTGLLAQALDLSASMAQLDIQLLAADTDDPVTATPTIEPGESFDFRVVVTAEEGLGMFVDTGSVVAVSQADDSEIVLPVEVAVVATHGGPDAWGNSWALSGDENGTDYFWVDIPQEDRTFVTLADDNYAGPMPMGGNLVFYGESSTNVYIGSNGMLGLSELGMGSLGNTALPTAFTPNSLMAFFWDDLNPSTGGTVYYGNVDGDFVLTYDTVREYGGNGTITAQVVIDFDGPTVYYNYAALDAGIDVNGCTVGIENEDGTVGLQVLMDGNLFAPSAQTTIRFDLAPPPDHWFGMDEFVSIVSPTDNTATGSFTLYNTGLLADSYQLSASNPDGFDVWTEINGTPTNVTPQVPAGGSITVQVAIEIPEISPVSLTNTTLTAGSVGSPQVTRAGVMETRIVLVQGGPDGGGYFWSTSDADGQVEYEWETMTNPVTVTLTDDSYAGPFQLGFNWNHYDVEYSQVWIGSNGYIGFSDVGMTTIGGQDMPNATTPNGIICGFQDDLNPGVGGTVSYSAEGDMFIVEYSSMPEFGGAGTITFQIILDDSEEAVRVNYQAFNGLDMSFYTIGQENDSGTLGFTAALWGQGWVPTNESAIWFGANVIGPSGPYAVSIDPEDAAGVGINGGYAEYEFEVENRGENASTFDLGVTGNAWDVTFHDIGDDWAEITQIPVMAYDELFLLGVRVHVPVEPASYTDQALVSVTATGHTEAVAETNILTSASCNHVSQMIANVTGTGLFGMDHLSDGEFVDTGSLVFVASGVNRMVTLNMNGTVGAISVLPVGHDYQGIAYDSRDGSYWLTRPQGITHVGANGALIAHFEPALLASGTGRVPAGAAFDADHNMLWVLCSHGAIDEFVRLDVGNAAAPEGLNVVTVPWSAPFGSGAAGLDYHEDTDQMVALHSVTGASECFLDLGNGTVDARGDYCPSGLADGHGVALTPDGDLYIGWTSGLAHPVDQYRAPCDFGVGTDGPLPVPVSYELQSNYPNPFNPSTTIRFALPAAGMVKLEVYNLLGQLQATLVEGLRPAGYHEVRFDAGDLASGVYFSRVTVLDLAGNERFASVRKMMLMK